MEIFFFSYWWLIFPIMWFVMHMCRTGLRHMRQRDAMDVARAYAAQGKQPPAEISRILAEQRV